MRYSLWTTAKIMKKNEKATLICRTLKIKLKISSNFRVNRQEAEKSRLVECPLDSDEEKDSEEAKPKTEASQSKRRES